MQDHVNTMRLISNVYEDHTRAATLEGRQSYGEAGLPMCRVGRMQGVFGGLEEVTMRRPSLHPQGQYKGV